MSGNTIPFAKRPENVLLARNANEALNLVANGLEGTRRWFGEQDFPEDNGVAFRNAFWKFPVAFLASELLDPPETEIRDSVRVPSRFIAVNFQRLRTCSPHQLFYLTGVLHLKAIAGAFIRSLPEDRMFWGKEHFNWLSVRLDWIANTYGIGSQEQPITTWWFNACKLPEHEAHESTESMLYAEVVRTIGVDPHDEVNKKSWSGMAWICLTGHQWDEAAWERDCRQTFQ